MDIINDDTVWDVDLPDLAYLTTFTLRNTSKDLTDGLLKYYMFISTFPLYNFPTYCIYIEQIEVPLTHREKWKQAYIKTSKYHRYCGGLNFPNGKSFAISSLPESRSKNFYSWQGFVADLVTPDLKDLTSLLKLDLELHGS